MEKLEDICYIAVSKSIGQTLLEFGNLKCVQVYLLKILLWIDKANNIIFIE